MLPFTWIPVRYHLAARTCGQKGGCYGDITGFKVDRKTTGERGKGSNGPAFAGAWETGGKHGKWRGCAASGVFGRLGALPVGKYTTVFSVHGCGSYCYESHGRQIFVDAAFFEEREWYVRLMLEGEDRLMKNRESSRKGKVVSYHAVSEEWFSCLPRYCRLWSS